MYRDIIDILKYLGFSGEVKFMGFRTLEISCAADIHIKEGQLKITTDNGVAVVPIEDMKIYEVMDSYYKTKDKQSIQSVVHYGTGWCRKNCRVCSNSG